MLREVAKAIVGRRQNWDIVIAVGTEGVTSKQTVALLAKLKTWLLDCRRQLSSFPVEPLVLCGSALSSKRSLQMSSSCLLSADRRPYTGVAGSVAVDRSAAVFIGSPL